MYCALRPVRSNSITERAISVCSEMSSVVEALCFLNRTNETVGIEIVATKTNQGVFRCQFSVSCFKKADLTRFICIIYCLTRLLKLNSKCRKCNFPSLQGYHYLSSETAASRILLRTVYSCRYLRYLLWSSDYNIIYTIPRFSWCCRLNLLLFLSCGTKLI